MTVIIAASVGAARAQTETPLSEPVISSVVNGTNPGEAIVTWNTIAGANFYRVGWVPQDEYNRNVWRVIFSGGDIYALYTTVDISALATTYTVTGLTLGENTGFK